MKNWRYNNDMTGVINDPLGQTHSLASSEHCFHFVLFGLIWKVGMDLRTMISTGHDCGLAEWIKNCS